MEDPFDPFEMLEDTTVEIIKKISAMAYSIRCDWSDPRAECGEISRLCEKLELLDGGGK